MIFKHNTKEALLRKQQDLLEKINLQIKAIFDKLLQVKEIEHVKNSEHSCKGICNINHQRYSWRKSTSTSILNKINEKAQANHLFKCEVCVQTFTNKTYL